MYRVFYECHIDDCQLELEDGSRWLINAGDLSKVCCWIPTTAVKIEPVQNNRIFNYKITNLTDGSTALISKL